MIFLSLLLPGSLRARVREWLSGCSKQQSANNCKSRMLVLKSLNDFPISFTSHPSLSNAFVTYDDEDLDSWESKAKRWARVFFLVIKDEQDLAPVLKVPSLLAALLILLLLSFLFLDMYA